jgi:hypothetical protein
MVNDLYNAHAAGMGRGERSSQPAAARVFADPNIVFL